MRDETCNWKQVRKRAGNIIGGIGGMRGENMTQVESAGKQRTLHEIHTGDSVEHKG